MRGPAPIRSTRVRRARAATVIDFDNKAYKVSDGVMHINPSAIEQTKEDFKVTSPDLIPNKKNSSLPSILMQVPRILQE